MLKLLREASFFAWKNFKNNMKNWLLLVVEVWLRYLMIFGLLIGFVSIMCSICHVSYYNLKIGFVAFVIIWGILFCWGSCYLLIWMTNIANVLTRNALDVAENIPMRKFKKPVFNSSLFFGLILFRFIVAVATLCLIFPGIFLYVRLYFYRHIILDEQCSMVQAFTKSWHITKNHKMDIFIITFGDMFWPALWLLNWFVPVQDLPAAFMYSKLKS